MMECLTGVMATKRLFAKLGRRLQCKAKGFNVLEDERRFRAMFGVTPHICSILWNMSLPILPRGLKPIHLLWALFVLKVYATEHVNCFFAGCSEKTFRKWCWTMIEVL